MAITFTAARDVPADADVLAVPVFDDLSMPDGAKVEVDAAFLQGRGFDGKLGKTQSLLADDGSTIVVIGMGPRRAVDLDGLRRAGAAVVRTASKAKSAAT